MDFSLSSEQKLIFDTAYDFGQNSIAPYALEWEKDQLAIWDNRAMLHQATPFKGNRILHRITIL